MNLRTLVALGLAGLSMTSFAAEVSPAAKPAPTAKAAAPSAAASSAKAAGTAKVAPVPAMAVEQIVAKNIAARGGLSAWQSLQSLTMSGEMDAGGKTDAKLPFELSMKRPHKNRLEIRFQEQTAVQVFDGKQGWKLRPFLGRNEVEAYTPAELKSAAMASELDGHLVDYAKKGTRVSVEGTDQVEGRGAYKLKLALKGGEQINLWIDAVSFLELKVDGEPRKMDGRVRKVAIFYRDFKPVGSLKLPHQMETVVEGVKGSRKMVILSIKLNPPLDDALFGKPQTAAAQTAKR